MFYPILTLVLGIIAWNVIVQGVRLYLRRKERLENERNRMQALKNKVMIDNYYRRY